MVYTTLLEPYYYPKTVPVEVTVLRGARRLRLSTPLSRKYSDFVPKIWNILNKLGYQRYLQKIYVTVDFETAVTSSYYQLPIVVAILEAIGMLRLKNPVYSIGQFLADYTIVYPEFDTLSEVSTELQSTTLEQGEKLEQYLNHLHTIPQKLQTPVFSMSSLFPRIVFEEDSINVVKTPYLILKKLPPSTYQDSALFIPFRRKKLEEQLMQFLQGRPKPKQVKLDYKKCFCEKETCTCTKDEKSLHTEQLLFLKEFMLNS